MFENLDSKNGQNLSGNINPPSQGAAASGQAPKVEDMFASVKDVAAPKPTAGGAVPAMPKSSRAAEKNSSNLLRNMVIIVIVLAVLLAGVFLASRYVGSAGLKNLGEQISNLKGLIIKDNKPGTTIIVNNEQPSVPENKENNNPPVSTPAENAQINNLPAENTLSNNISSSSPEKQAATSTVPAVEKPAVATTSGPVIDTDGDGLPDTEEAALGTNPLKVDTDGDGLSDYQEVKIYHTNPLKADTDGDGYLDGAEVKSGYNPNGPGKLVTQ